MTVSTTNEGLAKISVVGGTDAAALRAEMLASEAANDLAGVLGSARGLQIEITLPPDDAYEEIRDDRSEMRDAAERVVAEHDDAIPQPGLRTDLLAVGGLATGLAHQLEALEQKRAAEIGRLHPSLAGKIAAAKGSARRAAEWLAEAAAQAREEGGE